MRGNQKGFSVIEILILILIVVLLAGSGRYVYNRNNKSKQNPVSTGNATSQQEYVQIKDWGVRFSVNGPASQYQVSNVQDRAGNQTITIVNSAQKSIYKDCGSTLLERSSSQSFYNPATDSLQTASSDEGIKHLGDYYYKVQKPQSVCYDSDSSVHNADGTINQSKAGAYDQQLEAAGNLTDFSLSNLELSR